MVRRAALIANLNELQRTLLHGGYVDPVLVRSLNYDTCEFEEADKLPDRKPDYEKKDEDDDIVDDGRGA